MLHEGGNVSLEQEACYSTLASDVSDLPIACSPHVLCQSGIHASTLLRCYAYEHFCSKKSSLRLTLHEVLVCIVSVIRRCVRLEYIQ